jgi:hypothetical protein
MRDANALREAYLAKPGAPAACDTPLGHYLKFLLLTLERDAAPLFRTLADKYARTLRERDPALGEYVTTIGARCVLGGGAGGGRGGGGRGRCV